MKINHHRAGRSLRLGAVASTAAAAALIATVATAGVPAHAATPRATPHGTNVGHDVATPNTHLASGQAVGVSLSDFPANTQVGIVECDTRVVTAKTDASGYCDSGNHIVITTNGAGTGSGTFTVLSGSAFVSDNGQGLCSQAHSCYVTGATLPADAPNNTVAITEVSFSGATLSAPTTTTGTTTTPTAVTSLTVTPARALHSGQTVTFAVKGFPSNTAVTAVQCARRIVETGDPGDCDETAPVTVTTGATGAASGSYVVGSSAAFTTTNGLGHCDSTHFCYLKLAAEGTQPAYAFARLYFGGPPKRKATTRR